MPKMIYAPEVTIRVKTDPDSRGKGKVVDLTDDVARGSVTRVRNGISSADFTLLNQGRKYDGVFTPMDPVVVYFRRIKTVLKFSGYLDGVPLWAAEPGSLNIRASCTLKRLANFMWDPNSPAAFAMLNSADPNKARMEDGGLAQRTVNLLTQVAGWPQAQIHIARIPHDWYEKVSAIADQLIAESEALQMSSTIGSGAWVNGSNPAGEAQSTVPGIGAGTGEMPATTGKISSFGGPGGGAYGNMALTGEPGTHPRDPWYCAMRWPYTSPGAVSGAKSWWVNRKILVVNPKNNKAVVLRAADWGPADWTGRVLDMSPHAMQVLGGHTDDVVHMGFAPTDASLGPISTSDAGLGSILGTAPGGGAGSASGAGPIPSGWGAPGDESNIVSASGGGCNFQCHRLAKPNFVGFLNDLVALLGYHPSIVGGYNDRNIAGTSSKSNHAWGAAIDVDPAKNPRYGSGAGGPYALPKKGLIPLARKWGLGWGGEWHNSKDYMHFEVIGAPSSPTYDNVEGGAGSVVVAKWRPPIHEHYTVTNRFGDSGPYANRHTGTDFAAPTGTPIYPVGPGVIHTKGFDAAAYGNYVSVDMGGGYFTFYAHMEDPTPFLVGDAVTTETQIGKVDTTGNATGPHCHLELRQGADAYANAISIEKYVLGGPNRAAPPAGTQAVQMDPAETATGGLDLSPEQIGQGLFNFWQYTTFGQITDEGMMLGGYRALMNDVPILSSIGDNMTAGLREYCSAPNGDFIGWFPDYFGHYGQAGKMVVNPLEIALTDGPPTIGWSDENLKTHQFVTSASTLLAGDADSALRMATTAGIASIEFPELMTALLNVSRKEAERMRDKWLFKFGARPDHQAMNNISGARQEFFFACHLFMQNWSQQFQAQIGLSFMPELYPGMLACFPHYGVQAYVTETTDSFDLSEGGGFTTTFSGSPWSTIGKNDKAPANLPVGASL